MYVLKSVETLLNDKPKLVNVGQPLKLLEHEVYELNESAGVSISLIN